MAGQIDSKKKLLLILDFLMKYSDEENPVTMAEILEMLDKNNISAERKSVYKDIDVLIDFNVDIIKTRTADKGSCYYIGSRDFELVEVQILIDAVQSASFISPEKSKKLIEKIGGLCSRSQMKKLKGKVYINNRVKCKNEQVYYHIDELSKAIENKNQIECEYQKRRSSDKVAATKDEIKTYIINPYALIWSDDHYYLVANNQKYDNLMNLRIDRIRSVKIIEGSVQRHFSTVPESSHYKDYFDVVDYAKTHFNMHSGEIINLKLECKNELIEQIFDRFGDDASIRDNFDDNETFYLHTKAAKSAGLISWLMQFSDLIKVIEPKCIIDEIKERALNIMKLYN